MILLPANSDWPMESYIEKVTGMPLERPVSAVEIVKKGIHDWMCKTGRWPTTLLLPVRLEDGFKASLTWAHLMIMKPAWEKYVKPDEFLGLQLHLVRCGPMQLLGDVE
jgi:hypothetical protein